MQCKVVAYNGDHRIHVPGDMFGIPMIFSFTVIMILYSVSY